MDLGWPNRKNNQASWLTARDDFYTFAVCIFFVIFFLAVAVPKKIFLSRPINVTGTWKCCFVELLILTQTWLENQSSKTAWFLARPITQCHESGRIALEFPSTYESSNLFTQHAACAVWFPCKQCRQVLPQRAADRCYAATRSAVDVLPNLQQVFQAFHTENDCEFPIS
jgi:hypothetical protein